MLYMFVDPRYRLSWMGRFVPLIIIALILTDWIWVPGATLLSVPGVAILASIWIKFVNLVLAFVLFKVLSREAQRYRETAPDLPSHMRR